MKKIFGIILTLMIIFLADLGLSADYLFLHNNDKIDITSSENLIEFQYYSISDRSRIDIYCSGPGSGNKIFRNTDGWKTGVCQGNIVSIVIRETGDNKGTSSIPGCSDVVIRVVRGTVKSMSHEDSSKKGTNCNVCNKKLVW